MPTFGLVGFAPGASVAISVSQGSVSSGASVPSWGTPTGDVPQLVRDATTGYAIQVVSDDLLGSLTLSLNVAGTALGPYVRTAAAQVSGAAVNHVLPVVAPTATPGTYGATSGLWTHGLDPAPTPAYQWTRNGVAIGAATGATYATTAADDGTSLRCSVTVAGVVAVSNAVTVPGASAGVSVVAGTNGITFTAANGVAVSAGTSGIIFAEA
jgi:hypothetical protein